MGARRDYAQTSLFNRLVGRLPGDDADREPTIAECVSIVSPDAAEIVARDARHRLAMRAWLVGGCKGPRPKLAPKRQRGKRGPNTSKTVAPEWRAAAV